MRIGILSFHSAHNYGAVLQCYALQTCLKALGNDVSIIDHRIAAIAAPYKVFHWRRFVSASPIRTIKKCIREICLLDFRRKRFCAFENYINKNLNIVSIDEILRQPFDCIIVGSDQLWNTTLTYGYDPFYWGCFDKPATTRLITYAVSMEDNPSDEKCRKMSELMANFSHISVREQRLAELLTKKCDRNIVSCVDPTLLLSPQDWSEFAGTRKVTEDYVLLYQVNPDPKAERISRQIAEKLGIRLITISSLPEANKESLTRDAMPDDFVNLFKFASFVVASSFHGTVFALQFSKPFISLRRNDSKDGRVENLLKQLGKMDRFVESYDEQLIDTIISEKQEENILDNTDRIRSLEYLRTSIED